MLAEAAPDLLIVALPPFAHAGQVEAAARAGVNLLVEKPIALDMDRAEAMVAAVRDGGVVGACGFMYRFGEAVEAWDAAAGRGRRAGALLRPVPLQRAARALVARPSTSPAGRSPSS